MRNGVSNSQISVFLHLQTIAHSLPVKGRGHSHTLDFLFCSSIQINTEAKVLFYVMHGIRIIHLTLLNVHFDVPNEN